MSRRSYTALTLAVVSASGRSALKFQADMGIMLTFAFVVNMVMAMTALPAFAGVAGTPFPAWGGACAEHLAH